MKNLLKFRFLILFLVFGAISCDKEGSDSSTDKLENTAEKTFFEIGYIENANPYVLESLKTRNKKIKPDKLQKIFQKRKQLREEVEAIGYISWENLILFRGDEEDEDAIVLVPILTETSVYCTGFAYIGYLPEEHARYRIVSKAEIVIMPFRNQTVENAFYCKEMAISAISACDTELFGHADCELIKIIGNQEGGETTTERADCRVVYDLIEVCYCYNNNGYAFHDQWGCDYTDCYYEISSETVCGDSSTGGGTIGGPGSSQSNIQAWISFATSYIQESGLNLSVTGLVELSNEGFFDVSSMTQSQFKNKMNILLQNHYLSLSNFSASRISSIKSFSIGSDSWVNSLDGDSSGGYSDSWNRLTPQEKTLAKEYPIAALLIAINKPKAENMAKSLFPNLSTHNDKGDAFRHAFFNALNVRHIQSTIVKLFGDAHESLTELKFNLEKEMDLYNNEVGRIRGNQNWQLSESDLSSVILSEVTSGGLKYLKPINYNDICFYGCAGNPTGTHGITSATLLFYTNQ